MPWITVLGIPAMVYVTSITALIFCVNEKPQNPLLLVGAGLLTTGIYIFHRTSIQAIEPMQDRHRLAIRHRKKLLFISGVMFLFAMALFAVHYPLTTLLVFCSLGGIVVYGRKTITKPLRTFPYLKPLAVGMGIALFAWALNDFSNSKVTVAAFILICSSDALLCDLVDREYDMASGCPTLALQLGEHWTWILATGVYSLASIGLLLAIEQTIIGLFLFIVFVVSLAFRRTDLRYLVDLRLTLVLLLAWAEWMFWYTALHSPLHT